VILSFKRTLKNNKTSPINKLLQIQDHINSIREEINSFYKNTGQEKIPDRGDILSILIYILTQTGAEDLQAQLTLISSFISDDIKFGSSRLSACYVDFKSATEFLVSLEKAVLEKEGPQYLQNVRLDQLKSKKYVYDDINSDVVSDESSFDMFATSFISEHGDREAKLSSNNLLKQFSRDTLKFSRY
jgi:hypothetical protein